MNQIEAILRAESKRRFEANKLTEEYILDYLEKLERRMNENVIKRFLDMESKIDAVDKTLTKIENQFDLQDREVTRMIDERSTQAT